MELHALSPVTACQWLGEFRYTYPRETNVAADHGERPRPGIPLLPGDLPGVKSQVFSELRTATEHKTQLKLVYRSMGTPLAQMGTIEPHSMVKGSSRWNVRGHCAETGNYDSFALGSITEIKITTKRSVNLVDQDDAWCELLKFRIVPHPKLTVAQQQLIRCDYLDGTAARSQACRAVSVPCLLQEFRLAVNVGKQVSPDNGVAVQSPDVLEKWL